MDLLHKCCATNEQPGPMVKFRTRIFSAPSFVDRSTYCSNFLNELTAE